jgi:hypothetical protein
MGSDSVLAFHMLTDLIKLLINGKPEDGLVEAETCSHPLWCI